MAKTATCPDCGGAMYRYAKTCNGCKSKGERNARYGVTLSAETRAKISAARTGKRYGPRTTDPRDGRAYARRWFEMPNLCERCGEVPPIDRHHIDGNTKNNDPSNIACLCRRCHQIEDGRHEFVRNTMPSMGGKAAAARGRASEERAEASSW